MPLLSDTIDSLEASLAADVPLTGLLGTYLGAPAIFTNPIFPWGARHIYPAIHIVHEGGTQRDTLAKSHIWWTFAVVIYAEEIGQRAVLDAVVERTRAVLHKTVDCAASPDTKIYLVRVERIEPSIPPPLDNMLSTTLVTEVWSEELP